MINNRYILKFADSHNQYVFVDNSSNKPTRSSNPNRMTYWEMLERARNYANMFPQYNFICYELTFELAEVL